MGDQRPNGGSYALLTTVDPAEPLEPAGSAFGNLESGTVPSTLRESRKPAPWGKPRAKVPPKPPDSAAVGDVPAALLPDPANLRDLVKVGEVCGQQIYARRDVVESAARLRTNLKKPEGYWPADALRATVLALRMASPKPTYREIAEMLNMSERQVLRVARRGKKDVVIEQEVARLDREGMPMAVENVLEGLESGDKEYTLEFLKGRGVFRQKHETVQDPNGAATFSGLIVQFVHDGNVPPEIKPGSITANPNRALNPAVIDVEPVK